MGKLNRNQQEELNYERFVNRYKWKTQSEIFESLVEIKTSDISKHEEKLKHALYFGFSKETNVGLLTSMLTVLEKIIHSEHPAKDFLTEKLQKVQAALKN